MPADRPRPFLAIHGSADTVVPYNGKKPGREGSVPRYAARRAKIDGCDGSPRTTKLRRLVTRIAYRGCDAGLLVEVLRLSGTDHGWPGAGPPLPAHNPSRVSATSELLRFIAGALARGMGCNRTPDPGDGRDGAHPLIDHPASREQACAWGFSTAQEAKPSRSGSQRALITMSPMMRWVSGSKRSRC